MAKIRVWRNETKATYFGRPQSILNLKLSQDVCPAVAPGGKPIALGPGDEYHDDRGVLDLAHNATAQELAGVAAVYVPPPFGGECDGEGWVSR